MQTSFGCCLQPSSRSTASRKQECEMIVRGAAALYPSRGAGFKCTVPPIASSHVCFGAQHREHSQARLPTRSFGLDTFNRQFPLIIASRASRCSPNPSVPSTATTASNAAPTRHLGPPNNVLNHGPQSHRAPPAEYARHSCIPMLFPTSSTVTH